MILIPFTVFVTGSIFPKASAKETSSGSADVHYAARDNTSRHVKTNAAGFMYFLILKRIMAIPPQYL